MEAISTKTASEILNCTTANIRLLCADEATREMLGAAKMGRDWILMKSKVEEYAEKKKKKKKKKL